MPLRRVKVNGRTVWQARVAYEGLRRSIIRESREAARQAESELLAALRPKHATAETAAQESATLKALLDANTRDLEARGKGDETIERAASTALAVERLTPGLLSKPIAAIADADLFAFRAARAREGSGCASRSEAKRSSASCPRSRARSIAICTLRAALKKARPDYHFPRGVFFPEDETRVRWLRPDEELTVLAPMASPFREIATLASLTLMRLSEIRLLRRDLVHLEQGRA
jgi:hypothetical protein